MEVFNETKTKAILLQRTDCFLERFLVVLSDTHYLTYGSHLSTKVIFYAFEFLKCPAGEFYYYVVSVRNVFVKGSVFAAWHLCQSKSRCKLCRY